MIQMAQNTAEFTHMSFKRLLRRFTQIDFSYTLLKLSNLVNFPRIHRIGEAEIR